MCPAAIRVAVLGRSSDVRMRMGDGAAATAGTPGKVGCPDRGAEARRRDAHSQVRERIGGRADAHPAGTRCGDGDGAGASARAGTGARAAPRRLAPGGRAGTTSAARTKGSAGPTPGTRSSTASGLRRQGFAPGGPGEAWRRWSLPPWNGSTGSTIGASSSSSGTDRRQRPKQRIIANSSTRHGPRDSTRKVSGIPGAVHSGVTRERYPRVSVDGPIHICVRSARSRQKIIHCCPACERLQIFRTMLSSMQAASATRAQTSPSAHPSFPGCGSRYASTAAQISASRICFAGRTRNRHWRRPHMTPLTYAGRRARRSPAAYSKSYDNLSPIVRGRCTEMAGV